jgi:hypothetical protein
LIARSTIAERDKEPDLLPGALSRAKLVLLVLAFLAVSAFPVFYALGRVPFGSLEWDRGTQAGPRPREGPITLVFPPNTIVEPVPLTPIGELRSRIAQAYPAIDQLWVKCGAAECEIAGNLDSAEDGGDLFRGGLNKLLVTNGYKPVSDIQIVVAGGERIEFHQFVSSR